MTDSDWDEDGDEGDWSALGCGLREPVQEIMCRLWQRIIPGRAVK